MSIVPALPPLDGLVLVLLLQAAAARATVAKAAIAVVHLIVLPFVGQGAAPGKRPPSGPKPGSGPRADGPRSPGLQRIDLATWTADVT